MRFAVVEEARYAVRTREFQSLRAAAEFARDLPAREDFMGIEAVEYGGLTDQERHAFALFSDGKVVLD